MTEEPNVRAKANTVFARSSTDAPIGKDGKVMKTSVCLQIEESVKRAEEIEKQLQNAKVKMTKIY